MSDRPAIIDAAHIERQRQFSLTTFGPGLRTDGVIDHITKELSEIRADPKDIKEWVDVIILAVDGAWRALEEARGPDADLQEIVDAIAAKQTKNESRDWPDWRTADPGKAIEHVRCKGFQWVGQSFAHCDNCSEPFWEHEFDTRIRRDAGPFDDGPFVYVPITDEQKAACRAKWGGTK